MADNDRYSNDDNRDRLGQRDVYMDNRTGIGADRKGYRAEWGRGRDDERYGDRDENSPRRTENATFRDRDHGQQDGGRTVYRGRDDDSRYGGGQGNAYGGRGFGQGSPWSGDRGGESYTSDRNRYGASNPTYQSTYGGVGRQHGRNEDWQSYQDRSSQGFSSGSQGGGRGAQSDYRSGHGGADGTVRNRSYEADYADHDRDNGEGRGWWDKAADKVASWFGAEDSQGGAYGGGQSHRGKGPKNYRRSDDRVREDVSDRMADDHWLDASDIEVSAKDGEVTLSGMVKTRDDKRRAEQLAEQVSGVDNVQNNLRVQQRQDDWRSGQSTAMGDHRSNTPVTGAGSTTIPGATTSNMGDLGTPHSADTNINKTGKTQ